MGYSVPRQRRAVAVGRTGYQRGKNRGSAGGGRIRIIAGCFRGRRLPVAAVPGLRPTPERTRETLFNWLQGRLDGARVLDLFAGSGALGFEALSRGAAEVVFVDEHREAHAVLGRSAAALDPDRCRVIRADALRWPPRPEAPFDIVLLDPPFAAGLAARALAHLRTAGLLTPTARVYCEASAHGTAPWEQPAAGTWTVLRETRAGDSRAALLCSERPPSGAD